MVEEAAEDVEDGFKKKNSRFLKNKTFLKGLNNEQIKEKNILLLKKNIYTGRHKFEMKNENKGKKKYLISNPKIVMPLPFFVVVNVNGFVHEEKKKELFDTGRKVTFFPSTHRVFLCLKSERNPEKKQILCL